MPPISRTTPLLLLIMLGLHLAVATVAAQPRRYYNEQEIPLSYRSTCPDARTFTSVISEELYRSGSFGYVEVQYSLVLRVNCAASDRGDARWSLEDHIPESIDPVIIAAGEIPRAELSAEKAKAFAAEIRELAQRAYMARRNRQN